MNTFVDIEQEENNMKNHLVKIKQKIAKGELELALDQLQDIANNTPLLNEVILHSARLSNLAKKIHKGVIRYDDVKITNNQITDGVLSLIDEIEFELKNNEAVNNEFGEFFVSLKKLKEEESKMTLEQKKARFKHFDNYDDFINSKPPKERFELQKLNSKNYLNNFGLSVKELKSRLKELNYFNGDLDNDFNRELANSLEMFQLDNSMRHVDGFFGELTYDMIAIRLKEKE